VSADPRPTPRVGRAPDASSGAGAIELTVARLLTIATYVSVALLTLGVVLMVASGRSPLDPAVPGLDLARLPADLVAMRPEGALWLGIIALIATPATRVAASLVGYLRAREWSMVVVSIGILAVIAAGVAIGVGLGAGADA
jgi:uncharacterized membrane protein